MVHAFAGRTEPREPRPSNRQENERVLLEAAESIFAEQGFAGATTAAIARRAGVPKANLHYYFATKKALYRVVIERVLTAWLEAGSSFDASEDPAHALSAYICAKMDLARSMPLASRIRFVEIMRGAPMIQNFLDTTLTEWVASQEEVVRRWVAAGKLKPIEPKVLFYMIWATTQQYATAAHEIETLNGGRPLDDGAFERAKAQVVATILGGVNILDALQRAHIVDPRRSTSRRRTHCSGGESAWRQGPLSCPLATFPGSIFKGSSTSTPVVRGSKDQSVGRP